MIEGGPHGNMHRHVRALPPNTQENAVKSLVTRQEQLLEIQECRPERGAVKPKAKIPKGTPAQKSWHVDREQVVAAVFEALTREEEEPSLVGLVGDSGAGKTTAASAVVRSAEVREAFSDGVLWLSVNTGAKDRLPSLMLQLAGMVHESIGGRVGRPPAPPEDGAAYIKRRMEGDNKKGKEAPHGERRKRGLKCLVVADNVWEEEVVSKLAETGMWVLLSTRDEALVTGAAAPPHGRVAVGVDELSEPDAEAVLRRAAELPPDARLPDEAVGLIELCGRVAMDLAFVGRWSSVRGRQDRAAWSDAAAKVRLETEKLDAGGGLNAGGDGDGAAGTRRARRRRRRKAILRAGFEDLAAGSDDGRVPRLYLSLTVMPDGHAFSVADAATMLYDRAPSAEDEASVAAVLETLERWTVVRSAEGGAYYRMHDAHASFGRESLMDDGGVRRPALRRWVRAISSLDTVRSTDPFLLKGRWLAVERVGGGDGWGETRPYAAALAEMGDSDPSLRKSIEAVARFQAAREDWEAASASWRRLLEVEERVLGADHHHHPCVLNTFRSLADCAARLGNVDEAAEWYARERDALPLALAKIRLHEDDDDDDDRGCEEGGSDEAGRLGYVASTLLTWGPADKQADAEELLRRSLEIQEARGGGDDLEVAHTLQRLAESVRRSGGYGEADALLRRCLEIREARLGRDDVGVAYTLYDLGAAAREAGRLGEAEGLLRRCLRIREAKLGREDLHVAYTLYNLGECLLRAGRPEQAEPLLRRCLDIQEARLGQDRRRRGWLACTLHDLGLSLRETGRLGESEEVLRRCLELQQADLGRRDDPRVARALHDLSVCVSQAGRLDEAEGLLRRCLETRDPGLGGGEQHEEVASTLHKLAECVREAWRPEEAQALFGRCLAAMGANQVGGSVSGFVWWCPSGFVP